MDKCGDLDVTILCIELLRLDILVWYPGEGSRLQVR